MHTVPLSTISAGNMLGQLFPDFVGGMLMLLAVARLIRAPREWFPFGRVSKVLWVLCSLWLTWRVGGGLVPGGALLALWHLRSLARCSPAGQPAYLPFAPGTPVSPKDER
jgi:hypothetical protein